jgi:hypothetical protein
MAVVVPLALNIVYIGMYVSVLRDKCADKWFQLLG